MTTPEKLAALRTVMQQKEIDAFIVFAADPHMSEYLPEEWQERAWLSGFTGSAGFVIVTKDAAALWTDGRYFVQGAIELAGSGIELMKDGTQGTPGYIDWLKSNLYAGATVGVNAIATSHAQWKAMKNGLKEAGIKLVDKDLLKRIWKDRPLTHADKPVFVHPVERAGISSADKMDAIRQEMVRRGATAHVVTSLDDVAWTLNLRGSDVFANPVFLAYLVVRADNATLFIAENKLTPEALAQLESSSVEVKPYSEVFSYLKDLENETILISDNANQRIFKTIKKKNTLIIAPAPGNLLKAVKNSAELEGFRTVMQRDGIAMVKFMYWLTQSAGREKLTEFSVGEKLRAFRAEGENFVGESFNSIIGYQGNGAIIHYSAKAAGSADISKEGSILVDSGGQYLEGTTDITRTVALGAVSEEFRNDCTLVLKGMIQLSLAKFPKGTRGVQLDAVARMPLWKHGKDYNHGTGHGVGSFMNVHEGPQNIRKDLNPQELLPGMVCSNEPGFYKENAYGIRHENLLAVKVAESTEYGTFYEFETLTVCPFDKKVINFELLTEEEKNWLNAYHNWCGEKLSAGLEGEVLQWFKEQIEPVS